LKAKFFRRIAMVIIALMVTAIALFTTGVLWPTPPLEPARTKTPLAILHVGVIDVQAAQVEPLQTVLIEAGRIVAKGSDGSMVLPANMKIIDGSGRYLLPALWDMHTHVYAFSPLLDLPALHRIWGNQRPRYAGLPTTERPFHCVFGR
jgi:hypothetical protein